MKKSGASHFLQFNNRGLQYFSVCLFVLSTSLFSQYIAAEEDPDAALLKLLDAEAESSADTNNTGNNKKKPRKNATRNKKSSKSEKNKAYQKRFEEILENERPATYSFYTKLDEKAKKKVVRTYKKTKKISVTSKKVFDLYFEQVKK